MSGAGPKRGFGEQWGRGRKKILRKRKERELMGGIKGKRVRWPGGMRRRGKEREKQGVGGED